MIYIDAIAYQSRYCTRHTRGRMTWILLGIIASVIIDSPMFYIALLVLSFIAIRYLTKQTTGTLIKIMRVPLLFVLMSSVLVAFTVSPEPLMAPLFQCKLATFYVTVTESGLERGLAVLIRSVSTLVQAFSISLTMPIQEVILWMRWLHVPSVFVQLFTLTYRMVFVVLEEAQTLLLSQTLRFGFHKPSVIFRTMTDLSKILFLRTFWRLNDMEMAMKLRFMDET